MSPPFTVTHRLYWNVARPNDTVSAFLSYPNGMGAVDEYFWEVYYGDEPERFVGEHAESEMEATILAVLGDSAVATPKATEAQAQRDDRPRKREENKKFIRETAQAFREGHPFDEPFDPRDPDEDPFTIN